MLWRCCLGSGLCVMIVSLFKSLLMLVGLLNVLLERCLLSREVGIMICILFLWVNFMFL